MDTKKRFPNLANAFKYAMSQTVTLFGAFHPIYLLHSHETRHHKYVVSKDDINLFQEFWMGLFMVSSLYSFSWDVLMDWGLGRPNFAFLGPRLMFPNKFYYYGVMAADLGEFAANKFGRFIEKDAKLSQYISLISISLLLQF